MPRLEVVRLASPGATVQLAWLAKAGFLLAQRAASDEGTATSAQRQSTALASGSPRNWHADG